MNGITAAPTDTHEITEHTPTGILTITVFTDVQNLIDSGMAWRMEGHVGRTCMDAIEAGDAVLGTEDHTDYWGNHVPSRHQVVSGTKGSVEYAAERQGVVS